MKKLLIAILAAISLVGCTAVIRPNGIAVSGPAYYAAPDYDYYGPTYTGPAGVVVWGFGYRGHGYYRHH